jgi:hypothetical protein
VISKIYTNMKINRVNDNFHRIKTKEGHLVNVDSRPEFEAMIKDQVRWN